jgi:hypothetical protein
MNYYCGGGSGNSPRIRGWEWSELKILFPRDYNKWEKIEQTIKEKY